jgi:hypothetical protein
VKGSTWYQPSISHLFSARPHDRPSGWVQGYFHPIKRYRWMWLSNFGPVFISAVSRLSKQYDFTKNEKGCNQKSHGMLKIVLQIKLNSLVLISTADAVKETIFLSRERKSL